MLATNKLIKNTYMLLSLTLLFSAMTAGISMVLNLPHPGMIITLVGYFGLLWATNRFANSISDCSRTNSSRHHQRLYPDLQ